MKTIFKRPVNRRAFVKHSLRFSLLALLGFAFERRNNLKTEHVKLGFSNLPSAFKNFNIVQISDLHASFWVGRNYLTQVIEETNKLESDLLVITGDIITGEGIQRPCSIYILTFTDTRADDEQQLDLTRLINTDTQT